MRNNLNYKWFSKCGATFAALIGICIIISNFTPNLFDQTTEDISDRIFSQYTREPPPDIALVGSSLTFRLKEEYFKSTTIKNLAIPGGSSSTGLSIIAAQKFLPKLIAVETNIMSRNVDAQLVERHRPLERNFFSPSLLRPVRAAVAFNQHTTVKKKYDPAAINAILSRPPSTFDNNVYVQRTLDVWDHTDFLPAMKEEVARLKTIIAQLEERGTKIIFFELPFVELVASSKYAKDARQVLQDTFGTSSERWLKLLYPYNELRWDDGSHLDERSAVLVSRAIDSALKASRTK